MNQLLDDVLKEGAPPGNGEAVLERSLAALRGRRRRRAAFRQCLVAFPAVVAVALGWTLAQRWNDPGRSVAETSGAVVHGTTPPVIELISDEELFSYFPDRPLALVGPEGHQQLIFLDRPIEPQLGQN
ncbi:MAG TPA: hypothetical protein DCY13_03605 [Verrucomicrobiales bacterium]|nr:hypothetical protein [Verrucomicrobiales bacterium]